MYVCHCNRIPEREIQAAIDAIAVRGTPNDIAAADVLLELNRFGKCLGCFPLIESMLPVERDLTPTARSRQDVEASTSQPSSPPPLRRRRRGGAFARRPEP